MKKRQRNNEEASRKGKEVCVGGGLKKCAPGAGES